MRYDSGTPTPGEGWGPAPAGNLVKGNPAITTVLGVIDTTNQHLFGTLAPIEQIVGKTTGAMAANTANTGIRIFVGTAGSETELSIAPPSVVSRTTIANAKWGGARFVNNSWIWTPEEC